ncbi:hypothetical protein [Polymorphospora sp. NPDC050346]|uniref:hypothetical protein n=1 Tax=Polymorphospora sp. NPDC050346 TaxID=3155780 RepID=UPI0033CF878C
MPDPGEPFINTRNSRPSGARPDITIRQVQIPHGGDRAVTVRLMLTQATWSCPCGEAGEAPSVDALVAAGTHAVRCPSRAADTLAGEIATARTEMARVDPKAAGYLQVAGIMLGLGTAVLTGAGVTTSLSTAVQISAGLTGATVLAAITLLLLAGQPRLGGGYGFVAYASADNPGQLLAAFTDGDGDVGPASPIGRARELWWLSRAIHGKFRAIGWAGRLLLAGFAGALTTAVIAAGGW